MSMRFIRIAALSTILFSTFSSFLAFSSNPVSAHQYLELCRKNLPLPEDSRYAHYRRIPRSARPTLYVTVWTDRNEDQKVVHYEGLKSFPSHSNSCTQINVAAGTTYKWYVYSDRDAAIAHTNALHRVIRSGNASPHTAGIRSGELTSIGGLIWTHYSSNVNLDLIAKCDVDEYGRYYPSTCRPTIQVDSSINNHRSY